MNAEAIIYILIAYCVIREVFFQYTFHRLVNKLMSRNYHEFKLAESTGRMDESFIPAKVDDDLPEDLRTLAGIG